MSWEDFGGRGAVDAEARRLAYMLNTGDRRAEHEAARELSQDLYGLPSQAQIELVRRTQMYDARGLGGQLLVEPIFREGRRGQLYDTGDRNIRIVDLRNGVSDNVGIMHSTNAGYRNRDAQFDVFAGVNDCTFTSRPWLEPDWRAQDLRRRQMWNHHQNDWRNYDGRNHGRPGFIAPSIGINIDLGNVDIGIRLPLGDRPYYPHRR